MTRAEKERKMKLIALIIMCLVVKAKKIKTISEAVEVVRDTTYWVMELKIIRSQKIIE